MQAKRGLLKGEEDFLNKKNMITQDVLLGDAVLSIAQPHAEEDKGEPGDLTSHHLFSGVAVSAIHVGESVLLELHPVFL